ncbi:MAG: DUF5060 domain-containing protein, partial [Lentisphaerae bacterium]
MQKTGQTCSLFFLLVTLLCHPLLLHAATVTEQSHTGSISLYGTVEIVLKAQGYSGNPFTLFPSATFSRGDRSFKVEGFYDGNQSWKIRFMPDRTGTWQYRWTFLNKSGSGSFVCNPRTESHVHGHVKRDPVHRRYLIHDDGTPHHWYGGKWIHATNYGPRTKGGQTNPRYLTDAQFISYFDTCKKYRHNGLLVKMSLYPIENDKISWDLNWIHRAEWVVRQLGQRGIYCHVGFFDTWSRDRNKWFNYSTDGGKQVFNVWKAGDEDAKRNYIRTIVARFSGFYNVYWELGNEMEHSPNSGSAFVTQANSKYIPWIRQYDPYDLPIGLSEGIWKKTDVDIGFIHQTGRSALPSPSWTRPTCMNELVHGGPADSLAEDSVIRNSSSRYYYRRTFWRMFTYGGCGSSEATWLDISKPLNNAVINVMKDHQKLRDIVESLPVSINEMEPDHSIIQNAPCEASTRTKKGICYLTYFLANRNQKIAATTIKCTLPQGRYLVTWIQPMTGSVIQRQTISVNSSTVTLSLPAFTEDLVQIIEKEAGPANQAPQVYAGADQIIVLPQDIAELQATVTDDGLPNGTLSVSWQQVSGPAPVTFENRNATHTYV